MTAREIEGLIVMLQEERGEVSQGVLGCNGKSGVSTTAVPSNASFKALAIGQLPVAKNPCRNNIFFMLILYCLYLYVVNWMDAGLNSCFIPFSLLPNDHYSHCQHTQYEAFLQYDA